LGKYLNTGRLVSWCFTALSAQIGYIIIIIIIIITEFVVRGLQNWPMAHYNCSYGVADACKK